MVKVWGLGCLSYMQQHEKNTKGGTRRRGGAVCFQVHAGDDRSGKMTNRTSSDSNHYTYPRPTNITRVLAVVKMLAKPRRNCEISQICGISEEIFQKSDITLKQYCQVFLYSIVRLYEMEERDLPPPSLMNLIHSRMTSWSGMGLDILSN